jgi:fatty acid desaturase
MDYDGINKIRSGSTYNYAKKHNLIKKLNDYSLYYEVMEIFFSDDKLKDILNLKRTLSHLIFYAIGIILGILITPEIIVVFVFIAVVTWFLHVYLSIKDIDK